MCAVRVDLDDAVARLRAGNCVAIPTETVYGLAGDARNDNALRKIFALKGRPLTNPLIVHIHDISLLKEWVRGDIRADAMVLLDAFWPGPLTIVLPARSEVSRLATAGGDSVALRVPAHPVTRELLARFGGGLCAPSANRSGYVSPTSADHVLNDYADSDLAVLDGGECERGIESTIVRPTARLLEVLRPGAVSVAELQQVWPGDVRVVEKTGIAVPGSAPRHYAPGTPTHIVSRAVCAAAGVRDAVVVLGSVPANCTAGRIVVLPKNVDEYAARLYAVLRELDQQDFARILIEVLPEQPEWLALDNRLARASCPE